MAAVEAPEQLDAQVETATTDITEALASLLMATGAIGNACVTSSRVVRGNQLAVAAEDHLKDAQHNLERVRANVLEQRTGVVQSSIIWAPLSGGHDIYEFLRRAQGKRLLPPSSMLGSVGNDWARGDEHLLRRVLELIDTATIAVARFTTTTSEVENVAQGPLEYWRQYGGNHTSWRGLYMRAFTALQNLFAYWEAAVLARTEFQRRNRGEPSLLDQVIDD